MAGKGRGIGAFSFNVEALGIGRGSMPESRVGPNPLFPNTDFKAVPLKAGEDEDYMLALKQEMRGTMQRLPHNIKPLSNKSEVERYTERYLKQRLLEDNDWSPEWSLLPKELMPQKKKTCTKPAKFPNPATSKKKSVKISGKDAVDMLNKLDNLAKKDEGNTEKSDDETEKKTGNEEEEEDIEEDIEEEDVEEENDYIDSYFDNGEDFAPDSDENMDGEATY
ncbi:DNA-directed RNA polymerase III subunit RPC7 isoform 2-T2 [Spinachia spinachia]